MRTLLSSSVCVSGPVPSLLLTVTQSKAHTLVSGKGNSVPPPHCSVLKSRSPERRQSDEVRCPEGEKEAEIPLASLRSGPSMDICVLLFALPFLKASCLENVPGH